MIQLEDKLYTSTEVAVILGVSLRSVYRYIEENKLLAEVKTATGRHRFTKQNIIDFLYPTGESMPRVEKREEVIAKKVEIPVSAPITSQKDEEFDDHAEPEIEVKSENITRNTSDVEEEPVDWLAKFREAAKKFESEAVVEKKDELPNYSAPSTISSFSDSTYVEKEPELSLLFFRSKLGGLKEIAQNLDKSSRNSGLDYAFTMSAGLSLHSPIKPFSLLHSYVRSKDRAFFEKVLMLTPSDESNAQLCLLISDDNSIYGGVEEMHGLSVVSRKRLLSDIKERGDSELYSQAESILVK